MGLIKEGHYINSYLFDGIYADLRTACNMWFQIQPEFMRVQRRIRYWLRIYFPEYKTECGKSDAISGMIVLKQAPLPEDILSLDVEGVN